MNKKNILCIGAGYVGGSTMAMIAYKCPDINITVVDIDHEKINAWNSDCLPIYEPGLDQIIKKVRNKNLFFNTDLQNGIKNNDIIFVCVNTPTKTYGIGANMSSDLQYWEKTARLILKYSQSSKIIIEKSTLPVKTAQAMDKILNNNSNKFHFEILSNPEFLAEGTAIKDLENPDRVLIGSYETETGINARNIIIDIYASWISKERILTSNIWSAELSKLVANAFLAQRVSSINSISALCEVTGADITEISYSIGKDKRIGDKFLNASIGFGGSCFQKDIMNLIYICKNYGLNEVADYWEGVIKINEYQKNRFIFTILKTMFNSLANKKICIFGCAFKENTSDIRESPAILIIKKLIEEKATIIVSDPKALANLKNELIDISNQIQFEIDPYLASKNSDAILILTKWDIYKELDYQEIYNNMRHPAYLFDTHNLLNKNICNKIGFDTYSIGTSK